MSDERSEAGSQFHDVERLNVQADKMHRHVISG